MENILKLGGKEFKVTINFRKSYDLTKYRNKISMGFDFENADKDVVKEIMTMSQQSTEGKNVDITKLSTKALAFLRSKSEKNLFTYDEIIDICKILTDINDEKEIEELLNKENEETGFDEVITKLTNAISLVFMNAKGTSK